MKKYGVKILSSGAIQNENDDLETVRSAAISLAKWNIACQVINLRTGAVEQELLVSVISDRVKLGEE